MRFVETPLRGVKVVELEPHADERGFFARAFDIDEFNEAGLNPRVAQSNLSHNLHRGTLRGFHYQRPPHAEAKHIRCIRGAAFMVVVDIQPDSPTHLQHTTVELRAGDQRSLYVPEGCAVGFQTLEDVTELLYNVSESYTPGAEGGLRYDDPALGVAWPLPVATISDKDAAWPYLELTATTS